MEDLNLHFTGDIHAIGAANNLLAALLEAHLLHGNKLGIDPLTISWRRCVDINDRALRQIVVGARRPRERLPARDRLRHHRGLRGDGDRRRRARPPRPARSGSGAITVGYTYEGEPVTAEQLQAAGAMTVLLKDAIKPNLIQTLEGQPALRPLRAVREHRPRQQLARRRRASALKLGDFVVTECGFGSDMGMEKFLDIVCRVGGLAPSAVVLVATVRALKHHGGDPDGGLEAIERGAANLQRHLGIVKEFGLNAVVAVNRFPGTRTRRSRPSRKLALDYGAHAAELNEAFERGGEGAAALAEAVVARGGGAEPISSRIYELDEPIEDEDRGDRTQGLRRRRRRLPARRAARRSSVTRSSGFDTLPICMAKTHLSLSHDPTLLNAPTGFTVTVRDIRAYTGAGWLVALLRRHADDARPRRHAGRLQTSTSTRTGRRSACSEP